MPDNNTEQLQGSPSSDQRLRVDWDNGNHFDVSPDRYAPHLSEFYPIVNSKRPVASSAGSENNDHLDDMNHLRSSKVYSKARRASSITSGTSTINDLQTLITKRCERDPGSPIDITQELECLFGFVIKDISEWGRNCPFLRKHCQVEGLQ